MNSLREARSQSREHARHRIGNALTECQYRNGNQNEHDGIFNRRYAFFLLLLGIGHDLNGLHTFRLLKSCQFFQNVSTIIKERPKTVRQLRLDINTENTFVTEPAMPEPNARTAIATRTSITAYSTVVTPRCIS